MTSATNAQMVLSLMLSMWIAQLFISRSQEERNCKSVKNQQVQISNTNVYSPTQHLIAFYSSRSPAGGGGMDLP